MLNGENWQECVPKAVVRIVEAVKGIERLKKANSSD